MSAGHHPPASDGVIAELLRDGDDYGLSRFYAAHAGSVHAYARRLVGPTAADDAMAGALATAVARVRAGDSSPLSHLVEDAIRRETLTRVRDAEEESSPRWRRRARPDCQRTPALLAARAAGRLSAQETESLQRHLDDCPSCRELARRATEAEQAFTQASAAPIGAAQDAALAAMAEEAGGDIPAPVAPPPIDIAAVALEPERASVAEPELRRARARTRRAAAPGGRASAAGARRARARRASREPEPVRPPDDPEPVAAEPAAAEPAAAVGHSSRRRRGGGRGAPRRRDRADGRGVAPAERSTRAAAA